MEHTGGIDTDEVEKKSSQKVEENERNVHPSVNTDSVWVAQSTGAR